MSEVRAILDGLNGAQIRYVHFKSSEHLQDNFTAKSDFDILVHRDDQLSFRRVMMDHGAKQFEPRRYGAYPGVENWLIYDSDSGHIFHFHIHFHMASGISLYKDYMLPWHELFLNRRVLNDEYGMYIADQSLEIVLLLVRMVIKTPPTDCLMARLGRLKLPKGMLREFEYLLGEVDAASASEAARAMFQGEAARECATGIIGRGKLIASDFVALSGAVRRELTHSRRAGRAGARLHGLGLSLSKAREQLIGKAGAYPIFKKTPAAGGIFISFVGIDGSGKSTASKDIYRWLNKKVETRHGYLGSGKELGGRAIRLVRRFAGSAGSIKQIEGQKLSANSLKRGARAFMYALTYWLISRRVASKLVRLNRYRLNGGVVITDRFPQDQLPGVNDGPKLTQLIDGKPGIMRRMAVAERRAYSLAETGIRPDVVIRMNISAETSMARHPEQKNIETYRQKIEQLNKIEFHGCRVIDVDAERPLDQVMREVKLIVWDNL